MCSGDKRCTLDLHDVTYGHPEAMKELRALQSQLERALARHVDETAKAIVRDARIAELEAELTLTAADAATLRAERLTLARAFEAAMRDLDCGDNSCRFKAHGKGGMRTNGGCQCLGVKDGGGLRGVEVSRAVEVARRIVAEADAKKTEAGDG